MIDIFIRQKLLLASIRSIRSISSANFPEIRNIFKITSKRSVFFVDIGRYSTDSAVYKKPGCDTIVNGR